MAAPAAFKTGSLFATLSVVGILPRTEEAPMTAAPLHTRPWWRDPALGTRRRIELPTGRLDVFEAGAGEPIVFVHGLLVNANLWRHLIPRLAPQSQCVTIDLPFGAHARSMPTADLTPPGLATLVIDAIEALGLGPVTLVGNNSGGAVCQLVATRRPDLLARLVLTSCDAYDNFPPKAFGYLKLAARVPGAIWLMVNVMRVPVLRRLPLAFGLLTRRPIERAASDSYALPAVAGRDIRDDLRRLLASLDSRHTLAAARRFGEFDRPVLIAWSQRDWFFPAGHAERLAGAFPDARLAWLPDARTLSPEDQPARLAGLIADFHAGSPKPAATGQWSR
jgi:pimeloyl-ACP methyl ester carboxylesterase